MTTARKGDRLAPRRCFFCHFPSVRTKKRRLSSFERIKRTRPSFPSGNRARTSFSLACRPFALHFDLRKPLDLHYLGRELPEVEPKEILSLSNKNHGLQPCFVPRRPSALHLALHFPFKNPLEPFSLRKWNPTKVYVSRKKPSCFPLKNPLALIFALGRGEKPQRPRSPFPSAGRWYLSRVGRHQTIRVC